MDARESPALLPALGLVLGTGLAPYLTFQPRPALVLVIALGVTLRTPTGRFAACLALGLLNAGLQWIEPRQAMDLLELTRPVVVVVRTTSHPIRQDEDSLLRTRTRRLRQGRRVATVRFDLLVILPDGTEPPELGSTLRLRGYLRRSPGFANRPGVEPGPWRMRLRSPRFLSIDAPPGIGMRLAGRLRRGVEAELGRLDESRTGPGLPLARALLLGDRSQLPLSWQQALRRLGLAHLLAVSGLHVGLLGLLLVVLGAALPRRMRYLLALAGIVVYLLLIGPRPAVLRASIMGLLALAALLFDRPPQALNALACCVFVLVLHRPAIVTEVGFQLSAAATAGIVILSPLFFERWILLPALLRRPLATTAAAQIATLPFLLPLAGVCHPLAALLNLPAIPWLALYLLVAFPWLAIAMVSSSAARVLLPLLDALAAPLAGLGSLPPTSAELLLVAARPHEAWIAFGVLVAAGLWPRWAVRGLLVAVLLLLKGAAPPAAFGPAAPELVVFDVGQGDAILLRDGPRALLVDGGGWPAGDLGGRVLLPALAEVGVRRLEAVALTHPDLDHCGGLVDLVHYLPVREIWMAPGWLKGGCASQLLSAPGPRWRVMWRDERAHLGRWRLRALHPGAGERHGENDRSLVLMAEFAGRRALLTGDIEATGERDLVRRLGDGLRADVLKVAHHGSKTSTTPQLLRCVRPRIGLVSAGQANPYGHPAPLILGRLEAHGVRVLRTDQVGRISLSFHPAGRIEIALPAAPRVRRLP
ncbi:MAG: DNA internalization-related competence protein ComEC/Rec2 [bacterium]|nr:DNA internalization-related competence protein ComEC/Rec2 [bacterium]